MGEQQQQEEQEQHATATAAPTDDGWAELTTIEEYAQKCAGSLEAIVANSCANEDEGQPLCK